MTVDASQAWYVYAVLPAGIAAPAEAGVLPGTQLQAVPCGDFTVFASLVPRALFDSASPLHRTAEPDWMAARIEAHHAVNIAAMHAGPCLPMTFGALFSSLALLREWVTPRTAALREALSRVAGRTEWTLSLQEDTAAHATWLEQHDPKLLALVQAVATASPGTAFLLSRRLEKARATARAHHLESTAAAITARLAAPLALLTQAQRAGLPTWTVLAQARDTLANLIAAHESDLHPTGLSLGLSGPWPAYTLARTALQPEPAHV